MNGTSGLRKTHHIRPRMASRFFKAAEHSEGQAQAMNLFVTLNLTHTGCTEQQASQVNSMVLAKFGRWLRYQSKKAAEAGCTGYGAPTYESVVENPNGLHHLHLMLHVPLELRALFEKALPKWVAKSAGGIIAPAGAIDIKPIDTVMALSRYLMKGVEPYHAKRCYVRPKDQGVVLGKRVQISRSLGPAARIRATASFASRHVPEPSPEPAPLNASPP